MDEQSLSFDAKVVPPGLVLLLMQRSRNARYYVFLERRGEVAFCAVPVLFECQLPITLAHVRSVQLDIWRRGERWSESWQRPRSTAKPFLISTYLLCPHLNLLRWLVINASLSPANNCLAAGAIVDLLHSQICISKHRITCRDRMRLIQQQSVVGRSTAPLSACEVACQ